MNSAPRIVQPQRYGAFHCIGADCEDTCCDGWSVTIDRLTYNKYQVCSDPGLKQSFSELVVVNPAGATDDDYATFKLAETRCPFLSERLCSIQKNLGEDYLSNTCAIYPRLMNRVGDALERTLDLSCPEAARILLLEPGALVFEEIAGETSDFRVGNVSTPDTPASTYNGGPYPHFEAVRSLVILILQERSYTLWKRLVILGHLCDKLSEMAAMNNDQDIPDLIHGYVRAINNRLFDDLLSKCRAQPSAQLVTVAELVVNRITSDFTGRRFLNCYEEFMHGLQWTQESPLEDITHRYTDAHSEYYAPFEVQHQHLMERYLINYVYRNLFPLGRLETNRKCGIHHIANSISVQYMLMIAYYAIVRTVLIGMSAFHKSAFGMEHVIKVIQCSTKAFQHSISYPARAIDILTRNGLKNGAAMAVLVQDLSGADL